MIFFWWLIWKSWIQYSSTVALKWLELHLPSTVLLLKLLPNCPVSQPLFSSRTWKSHPLLIWLGAKDVRIISIKFPVLALNFSPITSPTQPLTSQSQPPRQPLFPLSFIMQLSSWTQLPKQRKCDEACFAFLLSSTRSVLIAVQSWKLLFYAFCPEYVGKSKSSISYSVMDGTGSPRLWFF